MIETLEEFLDLVERGDEGSHLRLKSEAAPLFVWEKVLSLHPELKRVVTMNKTLDEQVLRLLAKDVDASVRCDVANRRSLPSDLFDLLARDSDESVRARIAWNKKTPDQILRHLLTDESEIVTEPVKMRLGIL
jgi:hypothetical protein